MTDNTPEGITFTEQCRRILTEQPNQLEFTVSRTGLETLVQDSARYAAANAAAVSRHLETAAVVLPVGKTIYVNSRYEEYECYTIRAAYRDAYTGELTYEATLNWTPEGPLRKFRASGFYTSRSAWRAQFPEDASNDG